jgi:hypothetical protein
MALFDFRFCIEAKRPSPTSSATATLSPLIYHIHVYIHTTMLGFVNEMNALVLCNES